jgi:hypothetical protein
VLHTQRQVEREVGTGRPFGWWWIWIPLIIAAFWFCGWGWGGYGGWWWGTGSASSAGSAQAMNATLGTTGTGDAANKAAYIGQTFNIHSAPVLTLVGASGAWIGASGGSPMLLIFPKGQNGFAGIRAGERIDATGTVVKAPPKAQVKKLWPLDAGEIGRLEKVGVYFQASGVSVAP